jgi:transcriptional regulator with XRE-family HTH domain
MRRTRTAIGITQADLASRMAVTASFISKLEAGAMAPSPRVMQECSRWLSMPIEGYGNESGRSEPHGTSQLVLDLPLNSAELADEVPRSAGFPIADSELMPVEHLVREGPPVEVTWDIPQTITELSYLTHNFYRYYGKFPPTIPRQLIRDFYPRDGSWVLDNFMGSGTTLVEAKLAGVPSVGIDTSPLAVLASRVKCAAYEEQRVEIAAEKLLTEARRLLLTMGPGAPDRELDKWFFPNISSELTALRTALIAFPACPEREFLSLAYLAIVRRVSRAYDGEVRPHINPTKKPRDVFLAFDRKVRDMISRSMLFNSLTEKSVPSVAICGDNRHLQHLLDGKHQRIGLVIAHPPYLNCFDYVPVYKLEYLWAAGLPDLQTDWNYNTLRKSETRSWPATDTAVFEGYFESLRSAFAATAAVSERGVRACVVLGDCTIRGKVVPVIEMLMEIMSSVGFNLEKMIYRTTHYGTGKYAYATRAGYHGEEAKKRDGIAVFRRK